MVKKLTFDIGIQQGNCFVIVKCLLECNLQICKYTNEQELNVEVNLLSRFILEFKSSQFGKHQ